MCLFVQNAMGLVCLIHGFFGFFSSTPLEGKKSDWVCGGFLFKV